MCNVEEDNIKISYRFMIFSNTTDTIDIGRDQKFLLWSCAKVVLSPGPNGARSEIYTYGNLDISTHFGLKKNCMGLSVWPV